ncbi:MAG: hypothetical protein V4505_13425 [Pseudomonadota bacterium]
MKFLAWMTLWQVRILGLCVTFILLLALGLSIAGRANYEGYCLATFTQPTPDERIQNVVKYVLENYPPAVIKRSVPGGASFTPPSKPIFYNNVEEFLLLNNACCQILKMRNGEEGTPGFIDLITGTVRDYVFGRYLVRYVDEAGLPQAAMHEISYPISNCGSPRPRWSPDQSILRFIL